MIGVGTRYSDFTTSNETLWSARPEFININICNFDVSKQRSFKLWGDARRTLEALLAGAGRTPPGFQVKGKRNRIFQYQRLFPRDSALAGRMDENRRKLVIPRPRTDRPDRGNRCH